MLKLDSLRKKTILYIFTVIVLCAVLSAFMVSVVLDFQMAGQYRAEKAAAIESLSSSLGQSLVSADDQQINGIISAALAFDNISSIAVFDVDGNQVASVNKSNLAVDPFRESHEIKNAGITAGRFEIGFSSAYIDNLVSRTTIVLVTFLAVFLVLSGFILFVFLGRSVIRPIESITRTIQKITPDDLSPRVDIRSADEIGVLADNFNQMAGELERSHRQIQAARDELEEKVAQRTRGERRRADQLRAINEVSRGISSILSLDELFPYVVKSLQETFNYRNVNLLLVEEPGGVVLKARAGSGEKHPSMFDPHEGIVGQVIRTGAARNVDNLKQISGGGGLLNAASGAELAVPIKLGDETLGVLDIQCDETGAFDEIDLFTAKTLGDQLAVAIENARLYGESREMAVLDERNRMAREIHDTLAQGLTGIILQLEAAEQSLNGNPVHVQQHLDRARTLARESLNEARRSVWALRPQSLEKLSFVANMRQQTEGFALDTGVPVNLSLPAGHLPLSAEIENALVRILQESLTNIKKHACAGKVDVELAISAGWVDLIISDDGVGFDPAVISNQSFGLISMRERTRLLGGSVEVTSRTGNGTRIAVKLPIDRGVK